MNEGNDEINQHLFVGLLLLGQGKLAVMWIVLDLDCAEQLFIAHFSSSPFRLPHFPLIQQFFGGCAIREFSHFLLEFRQSAILRFISIC